MKIETQEQAMQVIKDFYAGRNQPTPSIADIEVLHCDSAICTIRFKTGEPADAVTQTIKIVGSGPASLLE